MRIKPIKSSVKRPTERQVENQALDAVSLEVAKLGGVYLPEQRRKEMLRQAKTSIRRQGR